MRQKMRRKISSILVALMLMFCLPTTAYAAISPHGVEDAFNPEWSESTDSYADSFGWNTDNIMSFQWTDEDGDPYERQTGWQQDFYENNVLTTMQYLGINDGGIGGVGGTGGSGGNIVAVALGELGKEDSLEVPPGSNKCKYNDWYWGEGSAQEWCAAFVCWCANECGYLGSIIPKTASCSTMFDLLTNDYGYSYYPVLSTTPFGGSSYTPVPGDLMFFSETGNLSLYKPFEHIGIIVEVEENGWYTVEGNTTGGGQIPGGGVAKNHFTSSTTQARVRNGYVVHVEYPGLVGSDNIEQAYNFLTGVMEFNSAAACGILANMNAESTGLVPDQEEIGGGGGYGICQWTDTRRDDLVEWCENNGYDYTTLEGQLWFFRYEIAAITPGLVSTLKSIPNTAEGAYDAAVAFCKQYEIPKDTETAAVIRGQSAKSDFWPTYGNREPET